MHITTSGLATTGTDVAKRARSAPVVALLAATLSLGLMGNAPSRAQTPSGIPEAIPADERAVIETYIASTRSKIAEYGAIGGTLAPLATGRRPAITASAVEQWDLGVASTAFATAALERLLTPQPDNDYTHLPHALEPTLPRTRHNQRFTPIVGDELDGVAYAEEQRAEYALAFLQGIERAVAARAAGADDWEARQLAHARDEALYLKSTLAGITLARKHLRPEWVNAQLPEPRLTSGGLSRFRRTVGALSAQLRRYGFPADLVEAATPYLDAAPATPVHGSLFAPLASLTYRRQEINLTLVLDRFAQRGSF